ncbi:MAG TPA: zinc ribbon domain-containing protein [Pyrinomonadaceae bacterium]|jgi:hypothetical protein|nr:zinc ribbon domain-containing protein [Pyrinomonadaceae bacterium]
MYCPQCAVENIEDAKFCRGCGADISLVPQALQGSLPTGVDQARAKIERKMSKRRKKPPQPARMDNGVQDIFKGLGLLCVFIISMIVFRSAFWWTIWFVIPALATIGDGIGQIMRARQEQRQLTGHSPLSENASQRTAPLQSASGYRELRSPDTAEMLNNAPPSVTEMTTRHLDAPPERVVKDA